MRIRKCCSAHTLLTSVPWGACLMGSLGGKVFCLREADMSDRIVGDVRSRETVPQRHAGRFIGFHALPASVSETCLAKLAFLGHARIENRCGLVVDACSTQANGHVERLAA